MYRNDPPARHPQSASTAAAAGRQARPHEAQAGPDDSPAFAKCKQPTPPPPFSPHQPPSKGHQNAGFREHGGGRQPHAPHRVVGSLAALSRPQLPTALICAPSAWALIPPSLPSANANHTARNTRRGQHHTSPDTIATAASTKTPTRAAKRPRRDRPPQCVMR